MANNLRCEGCGYFYRDWRDVLVGYDAFGDPEYEMEWIDERPCCHYPWNDGEAPCEIEDEPYDRYEDDYCDDDNWDSYDPGDDC